MTETTRVPFMEIYNDDEDNWFFLECDLCWPTWKTFEGTKYVCENEAWEHLNDCHPRRTLKYVRARYLRIKYRDIQIHEGSEYAV